MNLPKPRSINDYGGVKNYLDAPEIRAKHNDLGYKEFKQRINPNRKHKISKPAAAEDFGVSKQTFYDWIKRDSSYQQ